MKTIYVLADGLTEDPAFGPLVIDEAEVPSLRRLASAGECGWYSPSTRPFATSPETYVVFPFFFGLSPDLNPGRAGLELSLAGFARPCSALLRVVPLGFDPSCGWESAPPLISPTVIDEVLRPMKSGDVCVLRSPLSKRGNVFCVGSKSREALDEFLCGVSARLPQYGQVALSSQHSYVSTRSDPIRETVFYGWAMGGLHGALSICGVKISQNPDLYNHGSLGDFQAKQDDLCERIIVGINSSDSDAVIYLKEPSTFARSGLRSRKTEAVQFLDRIVGSLLDLVTDERSRIVVISDHRSDIGREETLPGDTLYITGIVGSARCEEFGASPTSIANANAVLDQPSLIRRLHLICEGR
jgi:hypothetical protein